MGSICTPEAREGWQSGTEDYVRPHCSVTPLNQALSDAVGPPRSWIGDDEPFSIGAKTEHLPLPGGGYEALLHLYDLSDLVAPMNDVSRGLLNIGGAFHVGLEVHGIEWSYGLQGISSSEPRAHPDHVYRETLSLGRTGLDPRETEDLLREMMPAWRGRDYDLCRRNCGDFCNALGAELGVGNVPEWVNRLAQAGGQVQSAFVGAPEVGCRVSRQASALRRTHLHAPLPPGVHADGRDGGHGGCLSQMPRQKCSAFAFDNDWIVLNALVPSAGGPNAL